ncbi:MAG: carboxypeptidase-like regulatory domain-containing protein [Flavobacteriales bacterium]|nr:carboxypeptidase-like regulatory domain-containing protein [Flavobacteriales bacterium]
MLRTLTILVIYLLPSLVAAQDLTLVVRGTLTDKESGEALTGAHIWVTQQRVGVVSDAEGNYLVKIRWRKNISIKFSFVGYSPVEKVLPRNLQADTIELNIKMQKVPWEIAPVQITARSHPDTVFGSFKYCVADFEFYKDKVLLLTYASRDPKASTLMLQDKYGEILLTAKVPGNATSLFMDYEDRYYVICEDNVYNISIEPALLLLVPLSTAYFNVHIKPGIDMIGDKIIFSDYRWHHPEFSYYTVWRNDTAVQELKTIVDAALMRMYRFEYYYLNNEQRVASWKLADQHEGLDEFDVAARMTGFQNSLYYDELYAPMFVVKDTVLIFDHYADKLYKFDRRNRAVDSIAIAYHKNRGAMKWKKELVKDDGTGDIYAVFQKNGYYYLNHVDTQKGTLHGAFKMSDKYADKMKIKDDYVYYVYDPQDKYQTPFLYKERIQL